MASDSDAATQGLGKKTTRGLRWNLIGTLGANGLRVLVIPILGRLLTPQEFGLVAAALTMIALATFLKDAGVGTALVQRQELTKQHIEAAFSFSIIFGIVLGGILALAAPLVATFYDRPDLTDVIQVLSIIFALRGIATVPQALARRSMQFRALALIDLSAYFVGSLVTVVLAFRGYGAWSLVAGYICETLVTAIALVALRPVRWSLLPRWEALRDFVSYGSGHTIAELAGYFAYQGDNIVIGRMLGTQPLGLYTRAYDLMRYPSVAFSNVAGSVLFSAFSRIQDDPERLGRVYQRAVFGTSVLLLPISVGLFVLAPEFVYLLLGDGWSEVALPFQILAIGMLPRTTFKIGETIARAAGDVFYVASVHIMYGLLVIGGAIIASRWGIVGVAVSTTIAVYINFVASSHLGIRRTRLPWSGFLVAHIQPILTAAVVLGVTWPLARALRAEALPPWLTLIICSLAGLCAGVCVMAVGVRRKNPDWLWLYDGLRSRVTRR